MKKIGWNYVWEVASTAFLITIMSFWGTLQLFDRVMVQGESVTSEVVIIIFAFVYASGGFNRFIPTSLFAYGLGIFSVSAALAVYTAYNYIDMGLMAILIGAFLAVSLILIAIGHAFLKWLERRWLRRLKDRILKLSLDFESTYRILHLSPGRGVVLLDKVSGAQTEHDSEAEAVSHAVKQMYRASQPEGYAAWRKRQRWVVAMSLMGISAIMLTVLALVMVSFG